MMKIVRTEINDVMLIEPKVFEDERGFFMESFNQKVFDNILGKRYTFVQDNHSKSNKGVLRGLHYQKEHTQGKLVRVITGSVFDVVVDLRSSSDTFGKWYGTILSSSNKKQLWAGPGMAHGFYVLEDNTEFVYKCTDYYHPESEETLLWDDPTVNIKWPLDINSHLNLSEKDKLGKELDSAHHFHLVI